MECPCYNYLGVVDLTVRLVDFERDYHVICSNIIDAAGDSYESFPYALAHDLQSKTNQQNSHPHVHYNRIYITASFFYPVLVMVNQSYTILENLTEALYPQSTFIPLIAYRDAAVLWIFNREQLDLIAPIQPRQLAELLIAFSAENLVYGEKLLEAWTSEPIRQPPQA